MIFAPSLEAQNFRPFTKLRTVTTAHFEFIFPPESEETAAILVDKAEDIYQNLSGMIGVTLTRRITVSITPHTDEVNGYMNPVPYPHILIFDTPDSLHFSAYENTIESLFTHELTHAICSESRGPVQEALHKVFGGWANMLAFNAPWFMIEGAAVAAESMLPDNNGIFGRANDPLVKEFLRRDILEDAFKTPFQTEGVWDLPPAGHVYYYYGGLFCVYLIDIYGPEKFRELWQNAGKVFHFSLAKYNNGFYYIFKKVYGKKILDVWKDFKNSITLNGEINKNVRYIYKKNEITAIKDVASNGGNVYFLEGTGRKIYVYNTVTRKTKTAAAVDAAAYALDISPDGKRFLVSTYHRPGANSGQLSEARAIEYSTKTGLPTGRVFKKLYSARYFRDGVIGIVSQNHKTNIAYRPFGKNKQNEILLTGNAELVYGDIAPVDRNRFAFIAAEKGKREIALFDFERGQAWTFIDKKNNTHWNYVRDLRFSDGRLVFQYNDNDRMSKAGEILLNNAGAAGNSYAGFFLRTDYWGGIHNPVWANGALYYKAAFSKRDALAALDFNLDTAENPAVVQAVTLETQRWNVGRNLIAGISPPAPPADNHDVLSTAILSQWQPYHKLDTVSRFFNPFNLWVPLPYIPVVDETAPEIRGLGGFFYISDPFDSNLIFMQAYYDWEYYFFPLDITWINFSFGIPIYFYYKDYIIKRKTEGKKEIRTINPRIYFYFNWPVFNDYFNLKFQPGVSVRYDIPSPYSYTSETMPAGTPYNWDRVDNGSCFLIAGLLFTNFYTQAWQTLGNGISLEGYVYWQIISSYNNPFIFESVLRAAVEPLPLLRLFGIKQTLYGTYTENPAMTIQGSTSISKTYFSDVAISEYDPFAHIPPFLRYLAGGETELKIFSVEAQRGFSHLYFNRLSFTAAYRWAWWGNQINELEGMTVSVAYPQFLHSVFFRLSWQFSSYPVSVVNIHLLPQIYFALKLSALDGALKNETPFKFGILFNWTY